MNNDFGSDFNSKQVSTENKQRVYFDKKKIFMSFVIFVIIICIFLIVLNFSNNSNNYSLKASIPDAIYMNDDDASLSFGLIGSDKNSENLHTTFDVYDDILSFSEVDAYGECGYVKIIPNSVGATKITVDTSLMLPDSEDEKELTSKEVTVTICPAFDKSLLNGDNIVIRVGEVYNTNIDFGDAICSSEVTYSSSDNSIISVSDNGVITGINRGNANLIISNGDKEVVTLVTVK